MKSSGVRRSSNIGKTKVHRRRTSSSEAGRRVQGALPGPQGDNSSSTTSRKPGVRARGHHQRSPRASRMSRRMCLSMTATSTRWMLWDIGCQRMRCHCHSGRQGRTPGPAKGSWMTRPQLLHQSGSRQACAMDHPEY